MIERVTNLWSEPADARCITTNGFVKKNGQLVMGAGVAGQAQVRYPHLPRYWGSQVKSSGNHVWTWTTSSHLLLSFPVKHNWYEDADLILIERSAHELIDVADMLQLDKILLPLPGCGNGHLSWKDVRPVLEPILDDRIWVINNSYTYDFNPVDPATLIGDGEE